MYNNKCCFQSKPKKNNGQVFIVGVEKDPKWQSYGWYSEESDNPFGYVVSVSDPFYIEPLTIYGLISYYTEWEGSGFDNETSFQIITSLDNNYQSPAVNSIMLFRDDNKKSITLTEKGRGLSPYGANYVGYPYDFFTADDVGRNIRCNIFIS